MKPNFRMLFLGQQGYEVNKIYHRYIKTTTDSFLGMLASNMSDSDYLSVTTFVSSHKIDSYTFEYKDARYIFTASLDSNVVFHVEISNIPYE